MLGGNVETSSETGKVKLNQIFRIGTTSLSRIIWSTQVSTNILYLFYVILKFVKTTTTDLNAIQMNTASKRFVASIIIEICNNVPTYLLLIGAYRCFFTIYSTAIDW